MALVYMATSPSGKSYIGMTGGAFEKRQREHKCLATPKAKLIFHKALAKYGFDAFQWQILHSDLEYADALRLETEAIAKFTTQKPNGYNQTSGGEGVTGFRHSPESKARRVASRIRNGNWMHTDASKAKLSAFFKGRRPTPEDKAKAHAGRMANGGWVGMVRSPEARAKTSASLKGRVASPDFRPERYAALVAAAQDLMDGVLKTLKDAAKAHGCSRKALSRHLKTLGFTLGKGRAPQDGYGPLGRSNP